jgi:hypothetical protein
LDEATANYIADLEKLDRNFAKTTSQKCDKNSLYLTSIKELLEVKIGNRERDGFPSNLERRKRGSREEIFVRKGSAEWLRLRAKLGEFYPEGGCGGVGRWFDWSPEIQSPANDSNTPQHET